jgi:hypothetical protein
LASVGSNEDALDPLEIKGANGLGGAYGAGRLLLPLVAVGAKTLAVLVLRHLLAPLLYE